LFLIAFALLSFSLSFFHSLKMAKILRCKADYHKYTYQPSIPDKHFNIGHWNYAQTSEPSEPAKNSKDVHSLNETYSISF